MSQKPAWLHEKPITLPNGDSALWSYDDEGDILEIFFDSAPASATVELADGVFLRFDRKSWRPLSLGFISATTRTQQQEFGLTLLALTGLTKLPELERKRILHMLQTPPMSLILPLYSFKATARSQVIPVGLLTQPMPIAALPVVATSLRPIRLSSNQYPVISNQCKLSLITDHWILITIHC